MSYLEFPMEKGDLPRYRITMTLLSVMAIPGVLTKQQGPAGASSATTEYIHRVPASLNAKPLMT